MPKFFPKKSRLKRAAAQNLGVIADTSYDRFGAPIFKGIVGAQGGFESIVVPSKRCRSEKLDLLDKYYENRQYDHLEEWDQACASKEDYVPIRERKPRIIYSFSKVISSRIASKIVGEECFPQIKIEDNPEDTDFIKAVIKAAKLRSRLIEPVRRMCASGSSFVRYYIVGAAIKVEWYKSKYCYPVFGEDGELISVEIRYVYSDEDDRDSMGRAKEKWFKILLGQQVDILYDNPEAKSGQEPEFQEVERAEHGSGFVQGEWFRTSESKHSPDGYSLVEDVLDFVDDLCYSLSQTSQAVSYNQDPQLIFNGMDEDDVEKLIRSSQKGWNLGKEGKAEFLETTLDGVKVAQDIRDKARMHLQDIARIALIDPEKAVANAQSGKAMEVLHGPMVELINELRPMVEERIIALTVKIAISLLMLTEAGTEDLPIMIPPGYKPTSLDLMVNWPPIFPQTIEDLQKKVAVGVAAAGANVISRETITRWLAKDFGVEDIEEEISKIGAQPILNPFGSF